ncbi:unnamed protein product [Trypanosoma congolense IL3000]|uniref:WGS project CAEQ00000000 data, annotated contig 589 n=1 Tax=Trypanosoma congolense (strain IL3000) TaxID=1068625 RepID=F9WH39_TRYCI|nr:unnamed protein product [Trypanosoma congolense IL3000]
MQPRPRQQKADQLPVQRNLGAHGCEGSSSIGVPSSQGFSHVDLWPMVTHTAQNTGNLNRRTIFISNLPITIDNGRRLLPYVPREGLLEVRVKRSGGRDVGFAEYDSTEGAFHALRWFQQLSATAQIACDCSKANTRAWMRTQPQPCYPVPYDDFQRHRFNPERSTELLLNSVVLTADWAFSTPICRPKYIPSAASVQAPTTSLHQFPTRDCGSDFANSLHLPLAGVLEPQSRQAPPLPDSRHAGFGCQGWARPLVQQPPPHSGNRLTHPFDVPVMQYSGSESSEFFLGPGCATQGGTLQVSQQRTHHTLFRGHSRWRGGLPSYGAIPVPHGDHQMSRSSSGNLVTSATFKDEVLPTSTLFIRVLRPRHDSLNCTTSRPCTSPATPELRSPTPTDSLHLEERSAAPFSDARQQRIRQGIQHLNHLCEQWSQFHHRHVVSAAACHVQISPAPKVSGDCNASGDALFCEESMTTSGSSDASRGSHTSGMSNTGVSEEPGLEALSHDFYSERFAGFRTYVPFSRRGAFVRFERPMDALQCLRWFRQQAFFKDHVDVQFAREDTRQSRPHGSKSG